METDELTNDQLVAAYVQLRDKRAARRAAFTEMDVVDKCKQEEIAKVLILRLKNAQAESIVSGGCVASLATRPLATVGNRDAFLWFVVSKGAWNMLDARCDKEAVCSHVLIHGTPPPGIIFREEAIIRVRR